MARYFKSRQSACLWITNDDAGRNAHIRRRWGEKRKKERKKPRKEKRKAETQHRSRSVGQNVRGQNADRGWLADRYTNN